MRDRRETRRPPWIYRTLLSAYPRNFRRQWRRDLEEAYVDLVADARRRRGRWGSLTFFLRAALEACMAGLAARASGSAAAARWSRISDADRGPSRWLDAARQELRHAARGCVASPTVSALAVLVFALGIGTNTVVYTLVEATLVRSLPYPDADLLVDANMIADLARPFPAGGTVSVEIARAWQDATRVFDEAAIYTSDLPVLTERGEPTKVWRHAVTPNFFPLLGAVPAAGRFFDDSDDGLSDELVAVVSAGLRRRFLDPERPAVGQQIVLDDVAHTVIGVVEEGFEFPRAGARIATFRGLVVWVPFATAADRLETSLRFMGGCFLVARLRAPLPRDQVIADLGRVVDELGDDRGGGWARHPNVTPLRAWVVGDVRRTLLTLQGAVAFVLLIACANVANLLLARSVDHDREIVLRAALGAGRARMVLRPLLESGILAIVGGALGILSAYVALPKIVAFSARALPRVRDIDLRPETIVVIAGSALFAALVAGFLPAWRAARRTRSVGMLDRAPSYTVAAHAGRATRTLLVAQVSLALVLLTGATLLLRTLNELASVPTGFEADNVVVAETDLPGWAYPDGGSMVRFASGVLERARGLPGVTAATVASSVPFRSGMTASMRTAREPDRTDLPWATISSADAGYFEVFGLKLHAGRTLRDADATESVAIIDTSAARAYFGEDNPLGETLSFGGNETVFTIVGVVDAAVQDSLREPPPPHVYVPLPQMPVGYLKVAVRVTGDQAAAAAGVRGAIREVGPDVPIVAISTVPVLTAQSTERERFYATLLSVLAGAALLIVCSGMFGVMSHTVARSTREMGVRMALGASRRDILRVTLGRGLGPLLLGAAVGVVGSILASRLVNNLLYGIEPLDPATFGVATAAVLATAAVAALVPARRAARTDPAHTLRAE